VLNLRRGLLALALIAIALPAASAADEPKAQTPTAEHAQKQSCRSRALGSASNGRLECGKLLLAFTELWTTYNPVTGAYPNARSRRWGTEKTLATIEQVTADYRLRFRRAPRIVIGDISLRHGGPFGVHASHQQGIDIDVYYPRRGYGRARPPRGPSEVDRRRSRWLVNRFADARARVVYIGVGVGLRRSRSNIEYLSYGHETHFHVRLRK
jgi:murein endopeptidase